MHGQSTSDICIEMFFFKHIYFVFVINILGYYCFFSKLLVTLQGQFHLNSESKPNSNSTFFLLKSMEYSCNWELEFQLIAELTAIQIKLTPTLLSCDFSEDNLC
jgi:hypothetical protein